MDDSYRYYETDGDRFVRETRDVDLSGVYDPFVKRLPPGALVLDAGCGAGRDTVAFVRMGYRVAAFDASAAMVAATEETLTALVPVQRAQAHVLLSRFEDFVPTGTFPDGVGLDPGTRFDGIWACASLLHVRRSELSGVMRRFADLLVPGGVFYTSFKYGDEEILRNNRYFNGYDEPAFARLLADLPGLHLVHQAITRDVRPGRENERWLNNYLVKESI
ncbi:MAG: class I SAM-dependent methyltransferase [Clostridiaceae bacterium]|jgi:SAM-dependent methyltransferase|nr:class I SAM-dependent methyltransferase [Clostridiaceae bacterium]